MVFQDKNVQSIHVIYGCPQFGWLACLMLDCMGKKSSFLPEESLGTSVTKEAKKSINHKIYTRGGTFWTAW